MLHRRAVTILTLLVSLGAAVSSYIGITSSQGPGPYEYETIRGKTVEIYGRGIYKHMSSEVAVQGIAQDYITFFLAAPLLLVFLLWASKGSLKGLYLLSGTAGYMLVTYLFYLTMGMYNYLFLCMLFCWALHFSW